MTRRSHTYTLGRFATAVQQSMDILYSQQASNVRSQIGQVSSAISATKQSYNQCNARKKILVKTLTTVTDLPTVYARDTPA